MSTLRDQITEHLAAARPCLALDRAQIGQIADAVIEAIAPELAAKDAEIHKWRLMYNAANAMAGVGRRHLERLWETRKRAERAEAEVARIKAERAGWSCISKLQDRAEQAEATIARVRNELSSVEARGIQDNDHGIVVMARHLRATLDPTEQT